MAFKIKPILTPRQLRRAKFSTAFAAIILCGLAIFSQFVDAGKEEPITWNKDKWESMAVDSFPRGRIVYFSKNSEVCGSTLLPAGIAVMGTGFLATCYGLMLVYLFLGISIVADIFMEAIEKITSEKVVVEVELAEGQSVQKKVERWNKTVANLSLMALGSSAPEILLAVLETSTGLGGCPGELGASTIVGSAAFNLLVISAICVWSVSEENDTDPDRDDTCRDGVKKIYNMKVYGITCSSSLFAYVWLWYVLRDQNVAMWEGVTTFVFFFILVIFAYGADKVNEAENKKTGVLLDIEHQAVVKYSAFEIYKDLLEEKQGKAPTDDVSVRKRDEMKRYLNETFKTDKIETIEFQELKKQCDGESLLPKARHKADFHKAMTGQRPVVQIEKNEKFILQHAQASNVAEHLRNPDFGFQCLHYSVSEAQEFLEVKILNKKRAHAKILVKTVDGEAVADEDYVPFDSIIEFKGQDSTTIKIGIKDDEDWEPDEDFFVQIYDPYTKDANGEPQQLAGDDTVTRITIIDDDKPGQICFKQEDGKMSVSLEEEFAEVIVQRKNGSDGTVTVDYETVQLGQQFVALDGVHYEGSSGKLVFLSRETEKRVKVAIIPPKGEVDKDSALVFGFKLKNATPAGCKLTRKNQLQVKIVADEEKHKKDEAIAQLLKKLEEQEEKSWCSQFITAGMLHPTKGEEGEIIDITYMDAALHFLTIGWKFIFAFIPPAHLGGGVPCFLIALTFIGLVTYVVGEFANLFGCVLGIKPSITAITFVALGTSLPDTFASMNASQKEKYADDAVGNVTGSNSVNVFLGLGLPWVIGCCYEYFQQERPQGMYYVPAGSLGFSVVVFIICAVLCVILLLIRRSVVGGELGGSSAGRYGTLVFLVFLWIVYIVASVLQAYKVGDKEMWKKMTFGIAPVECPYPK